MQTYKQQGSISFEEQRAMRIAVVRLETFRNEQRHEERKSRQPTNVSKMLLTYPYLGMNEAFKTALSGLQRTSATYVVVCRRKKVAAAKDFRRIPGWNSRKCRTASLAAPSKGHGPLICEVYTENFLLVANLDSLFDNAHMQVICGSPRLT